MILDKLERGVCFEGTDILIPWYTPMPSLKHYGNPEVINMSDRGRNYMERQNPS